MERKDVQGLEYDWLAVDADGFVALFTTAGAGYAPDALVRDPEAFDAALQTILSMPRRGGSDCYRELPTGRVNTWKLVAERGVFAFDADPLGGPYQLIAKPHDPVRASDLEPSVSSVAGRIVLLGLSFKSTTEVNENQIPR